MLGIGGWARNPRVVVAVVGVSLVVAVAVLATLVATSDTRTVLAKAAKSSVVHQSKAHRTKSYLYVQDAHSGTLVPVGSRRGDFELTLSGVHPTALYFLDRPGRGVGSIPIDRLLSSFFGKQGETPPNAALNALVPQWGNHQYTMGVTLLSAKYDKKRQTLRYRLRQLPQGAPAHREHGRTDVTLPRTFSHTSVFIDDGGNTCNGSIQNLTQAPLPQQAWPNNVGKWSSDTWEQYPWDTIGAAVPGQPGMGPIYESDGGPSEGCHNWINLTYGGGTIQVSLTDPASGSNTVNCDVNETDANYGYQCGYFIGNSTVGGDNMQVEFVVCSTNPNIEPWVYINPSVGSVDGCTNAGYAADGYGGISWFTP